MRNLLMFFALVASAYAQNGAPVVAMSSPGGNGSGSSIHFNVTAADPNGVNDIGWLGIGVGMGWQYPGGCFILVYPNADKNYLVLLNDASTVWNGPFGIGGPWVAENSQCSINMFTFSRTVSAQSNGSLTVDFTVNFKSSFVGQRYIYTIASDLAGWYGGGNPTAGWYVTPGDYVGSFTTLPVAPGAIVIDDATGGTTISTTSAGTDAGYLAVRLSTGRKLKIADAGRVKVHRADYAHKLSGDARVYSFHLDLTGGVKKIRLGTMNNSRYAIGDDPDLPFSKPQVTGPHGWYGSGVGWVSLDGADFSDEAQFTVASHYLPGPMPLYLMNEHWSDAVEMTGHGDDELAMATGFMSNSLQRWVIGPAFRPGITQDELKSLIGDWIAIDPQFAFLKPLLDDSGTLDTLQPPDGKLAAETIECLRAVWGVK